METLNYTMTETTEDGTEVEVPGVAYVINSPADIEALFASLEAPEVAPVETPEEMPVDVKPASLELTTGSTYRIRLSNGSWTNGVFLGERTKRSYGNRRMTHFMFRNVASGREIEIKSKQRIKAL